MDESPLAFVDRWTQELRALQAEVTAKPAASSAASEATQRLSQQLTARAGDLPLSELARCERELKALQESLSALKTHSAPKSKFSFKRSAPSAAAASSSSSSAPTPKPAASLPPPLTSTSGSSASSPKPSSVPTTALSLSSRSSAYLSHADLPSSSPSTSTTSSSEPLALSSLSDCLVDLLLPSPSCSSSSSASSTTTREAFSALYLSDLSHCVVLLPPQTSGSILIQSCRDCLFVLGGHQFRMHDSSNCRVFLQAGSTPIIERCRSLVFAGYPAALSSAAAAQTEALSPPQTVQDFDDPFASPERPSPNWRFAAPEEAAVFSAEDERWSSVEGRRDAWRELLDRTVSKR